VVGRENDVHTQRTDNNVCAKILNSASHGQVTKDNLLPYISRRILDSSLSLLFFLKRECAITLSFFKQKVSLLGARPSSWDNVEVHGQTLLLICASISNKNDFVSTLSSPRIPANADTY
jgi:hypothetical protein